MKNKRNHRAVPRTGVSIVHGVRRAFIQHVKKSGTAYAPALAPLVFFFLAHFVSLLAFVFLKAGALRQEQLVHKTVVTWAVFGFLPLLLSSYLCFYLVARPVVGSLVRQFPLWSVMRLNLAIGAIYGAAISICMMLLRKPDAWFSMLLLLFIGVAAGQGNWFFYRKLAGGEP